MHRTQRQPTNTPGGRSNRDAHRVLKPPERPLVPYMRFSRKMWAKVRADNPDVQLLEIGKLIGQMWREAPDAEKAVYQQEYELDKLEYDRQLKGYQQAMSSQHVAASRARASNLGNPSAASAAIQPVDEEDPFEMTRKRLAAIRYDRDNRLMLDLFSSACLPDPRSVVPQTRIDQLKRQAGSLTAHQNKLNEELERLEEGFQSRKRALEESSEKFNEQIKKVKDEKPVFTEEKYREYVEQWTQYFREEYEKHKTSKTEKAEKADAAPEPESNPTEEPDKEAAPQKEEEEEKNNEDEEEEKTDVAEEKPAEESAPEAEPEATNDSEPMEQDQPAESESSAPESQTESDTQPPATESEASQESTQDP